MENKQIKIGICDDEERERQRIKEICLDSISGLSEKCEVIVFQDGKEILAYQEHLDLVILDIEMPGMSGIEVKQKLQEMDRKVILIFVTNHEELVFSSFGIHVHGFVPKKDVEIQLPRLLSSALEIVNRYVMLEGEVDSRDVKYMKSDRVYSDLHLADGTRMATRISIKEYEKLLSGVGFIKPHKSYLVNLQWVDKITDQGIHIGTEILPVSFRMKKEICSSYQKFCKRNARYC